MDRKQFTFYESFYEGIRCIRKQTDRCRAYDAIVEYALHGTEPSGLPDSVLMVFHLARPVLDAGRRKAEKALERQAKEPFYPEPSDPEQTVGKEKRKDKGSAAEE